LPAHAPDDGEPWGEILADLDRIVLPGITHWQSPNFFGFFPANASGPAVLGDLVSSGLGVQGMLWATSPACTELETHVLDWLVELMDLPDAFRGNGVIQDSASSATLCAVLAARDRVSPTIERTKLRAYTSNQAHSSVEKGIRIAGLQADQLRLVDVDDDTFALDPSALADAIATDLSAGLVPFLVVATVGTTSSCAIDPVPEIVDIARRNNLWVHIDAAFAGSAAVVPELRPASQIDNDERFERVAPTDLSLVCFAHVDGDAASERLLKAINATGKAFMTHTRLHARYTIRVAIGATHTEHRHVEALWSLLDSFSRQ
jgi:aromatic-L-amino-acid decarboxylase